MVSTRKSACAPDKVKARNPLRRKRSLRTPIGGPLSPRSLTAAAPLGERAYKRRPPARRPDRRRARRERSRSGARSAALLTLKSVMALTDLASPSLRLEPCFTAGIDPLPTFPILTLHVETARKRP